MKKLRKLAELLHTEPEQVPAIIRKLKQEIEQAEKEIKQLESIRL